MVHRSVLVREIVEYLNPKPNENFIDATIGEGGHAIEILKRNGPKGNLLGIDLDPGQIENARQSTKDFKKRIILVNGSYANLKDIVEKQGFGPVDGILLDLGMSSWQLEESKKGFSFGRNEPLDMRYSLKNPLTAEKIINDYQEGEIEKILREYGQEKFSKRIAKAIVKQRQIQKIHSTFELIDVIKEAIPPKFRRSKIDPATRTFQALRIAVNKELDNLKEFLPRAIKVLSQGGRLVIISFHSLEDRIVKDFFKKKEKEKVLKILTKKPITAEPGEVLMNRRSRSAKLRAIIKV